MLTENIWFRLAFTPLSCNTIQIEEGYDSGECPAVTVSTLEVWWIPTSLINVSLGGLSSPQHTCPVGNACTLSLPPRVVRAMILIGVPSKKCPDRVLVIECKPNERHYFAVMSSHSSPHSSLLWLPTVV